MQLIAVGIAAEEAEEGDVIRAADHAETAGHEAAGGHILADVGLGKKADGLAVVLLGFAGGVDVPETVVLRLDVDDIRIHVKRQRHIAGVVLGIAVHVIQIDCRTRVHRLDVLLVQHVLQLIRAAVEHNQIRSGDMLEHHRADVVGIQFKRGRIDRGDDLVQLPAGRKCLHQLFQLPHAVVLNKNAVRLVFLLHALEDIRRQTVLGLDGHKRGAVVQQPLLVVLLDAFFAQQQHRALVLGKVRVRENVLNELGLAALQKAGKDVYRNGFVSHIWLPHFSFTPNRAAMRSSSSSEPMTHRRPV